MMKKILPAIFLTIFVFLAVPKVAHASTLFLSPGSGQVGVGSTIVVSVRLDTQGEDTNAVAAFLTYPTERFDVSYINSSGSGFAITADEKGGGGSIKITRGSTNPVKGSSVLVARVGLKAKTIGDGTVAFVSGSHVPRFSDNGDSLNLGASRGGTYKVVAASSVSSTTKSTSKDITPPQISTINVFDITNSSATISWKTDEDADSYVEFGLEPGQYLGSVSDSAPTKNHSLKLTGDQIQPGLKLFYRIHSKDAAENDGVSEEKELQLKGYQVTIKVVDNFNNPLKDAQVLLYEEPLKATTNEKGEASFDDVTLGKHQVVVKLKDQDSQSEITVADSSTPQTFTIKVAINPTAFLPSFKMNPLSIIAFVIILITVVLVIYLLLKNRRNLKQAENYFNPTTPAGSSQPTPPGPQQPGPQASTEDNPVVVYRDK